MVGLDKGYLSRSRFNFIGFDLDGTLVDTMADHLKIFGDWINEKFSLNPNEAAEHYLTTAGLPTAEQILTLLSSRNIQLTPEQATALGQEIDAKLEDAQGIPYPDVPKALEELKKAGYYIFVCSSHHPQAVTRILEKNDLMKYADFVTGTDPNNPDFKKGESQFKAATKNFAVPYEDFLKKAVFIGDGTSDMEIAIKTGVIGIGRIGTETKEELSRAGAKITLTNFSNLLEKLAHL